MMAYSLDSFPGREIEIEGKKYLYFGGTAYLGVQTDRFFQDLLTKNIKKYGASYGASRLSNIQLSVYSEAEKYLANWIGSEACLTLSSGYLAGQMVSGYFSTKKYKLFYAPNSHSALYASAVLKKRPKPHVTYSALNLALRQHLELHPTISPVVVLDTIDFSGYSYPDFEGLSSLPIEELIIVADDSHGIGIVGEEGKGAYQKLLKLNPKELLVCCSLGKALGIPAGAMFGKAARIKSLSGSDFFGGASPAAPAYLATLMEATEIYDKKRGFLSQNIKLFLDIIPENSKFRMIADHPVFAYKDDEKTAFLKENGILVTDFNYPNEKATLSSRIVLSAAHLEDDIKQLSSLL